MGKKIDSLIETLTWKETYPAIPDASGPELNIDIKHNDIPAVEVVESSSSTTNDNNEIFTYVEQPPSFKGGNQALMSFLAKNTVYPAIAKENDIQGKVICSFVVNKLGHIEDVKVERGIGSGCNEEALRVLKSMPDWIPGKQNGQPVSVRFYIPVNFILK
jgi:TonB family protein